MVKPLDCRVNIRLFKSEIKEMEQQARYMETEQGERKYKDLSHYVRCAIMALINENKGKYRSSGRPKLYLEDI